MTLTSMYITLAVALLLGILLGMMRRDDIIAGSIKLVGFIAAPAAVLVLAVFLFKGSGTMLEWIPEGMIHPQVYEARELQIAVALYLYFGAGLVIAILAGIGHGVAQILRRLS